MARFVWPFKFQMWKQKFQPCSRPVQRCFLSQHACAFRDRNARIETPDGMQVTLYQVVIPEEQQNEERS